MNTKQAKSNVETKIAELLDIDGNFILGDLRDSEYHTNVRRYKIGLDTVEIAAQSIVDHMTASTTALFNKHQ